MPPKKYGGFWKRFLAYLIDEIVMGTASLIILIPFFIFMGLLGVIAPEMFEGYSEHSLTSFRMIDTYSEEAFAASILVMMFMVFVILLIVNWLYRALMESSKKQATLGKMALGMIVTDMQGNRIGFAKATGRYFGKILSGLIFNIGFIIAAFTDKKQALHDMIAGTLVVNKEYLTWEKVQEEMREYEEKKRIELEEKAAKNAAFEAENKIAAPEQDFEPEDALRAEADTEEEEKSDNPDINSDETNVRGDDEDKKDIT